MNSLTFPSLARQAARAGDVAAAGLVAGVAVYGAREVFRAENLGAGAGDWHAHAYRIHDLARHGLAPWTHDWAGGLPLWSAYQFVPHALTWAATLLTGAGTTRTMAVSQGILLVLIPLAMFLLLRRAGLRTLPALLGALLAAALDTRRQPTVNYSELWGLALVPPLLFAAYHTTGRRSGYACAVAAGAAIYVHPLAAVVGALGMGAAAAQARGERQEASEARPPESDDAGKHEKSTSGRRMSAAWRRARAARSLLSPLASCLLPLTSSLLLALGAAAFFLWPAMDSARPAYEHPYFTSRQFERLLAELAVGSFLPGWQVWLGLGGAAAVAVAVRGTGERRHGARYLAVVAALVVALALGAMAGWGPGVYQNAQLPRLLSTLPLLGAAALALAADELLARAGARRTEGAPPAEAAAPAPGSWQHVYATAVPHARRLSPFLAAGAVAVLALVAACRGAGDIDSFSPSLRAGGQRGEAASSFTRWLLARPEPLPAGSRVMAGADVVANGSALAYGRAWYAGSYSGREWSIIAGPLAMFMEGFGTPETRAAYLTAMAVELAVVPPGSRPALADPRTGEPAAWEEVARLGDADVLRLPWRAPYAFTMPRGAEAELEVPDARFTTVEESYVRDELTRRWAALALGPQAGPVRARAPSGTTLDFELRELPPGRALFVGENWDTAWRAEAGGRRLPVRRAGPNFILVDLAEAPRGVRGDVHLRLTHGIPRAWWLGGLTVLLTLAAAGLALGWGPERGDTR